MANNTYALYVVVMLAIIVCGAAMIAGINYSLTVAKNFVYGTWRYRIGVLFVLAAAGAAMLAIIVHWLMTPDG
jgi:hypothetical protein